MKLNIISDYQARRRDICTRAQYRYLQSLPENPVWTELYFSARSGPHCIILLDSVMQTFINTLVPLAVRISATHEHFLL